MAGNIVQVWTDMYIKRTLIFSVRLMYMSVQTWTILPAMVVLFAPGIWFGVVSRLLVLLR